MWLCEGMKPAQLSSAQYSLCLVTAVGKSRSSSKSWQGLPGGTLTKRDMLPKAWLPSTSHALTCPSLTLTICEMSV